MSVAIRAAVLGDERRLAVLNGLVQGLHIAKRPNSFKLCNQDTVLEWFRGLVRNASARIAAGEHAEDVQLAGTLDPYVTPNHSS
jgi:hypothetical protein